MIKRPKMASFNLPKEKPQMSDIVSNNSPLESKLRFLLSNFSHDDCFVYKAPKTANQVNPRKRLQDLSQPLKKDSEMPESTPETIKLEICKLVKSPQSSEYNGQLANFNSPLPIMEARESTSPKPKEGLSANSVITGALSSRTPKPVRLRDVVRRKSCHCSDCGGISRLEKQILYLRPELKENKKEVLPELPSFIHSPYSNPISANRSKKNLDTRPRCVSVAAMVQTKRSENSPAIDLDARNRNKTLSLVVPNILEPLRIENSEKPSDRGTQPLTGKTLFESQESPKVEQNPPKMLEEPQKDQNVVNFRPSIFKIRNSHPKKIELRRLTPDRIGKYPQTSRMEQSTSSLCLEQQPPLAEKGGITERKIVKHARQKSLEQNASLNKDKFSSLKSLINLKCQEIKAVEIPALDNVPENSSLHLHLKKIIRKENNSSSGHKRASSVSRLSEITVVQRGVNNATKCYMGRRRRDSGLEITEDWVGKIGTEHTYRGVRLSKNEEQSIRDRRANLNAMREEMTCENILRSVRESLEREKEIEKNENDKNEDINKNYRNFIPMFLMTSRSKLSRNNDLR